MINVIKKIKLFFFKRRLRKSLKQANELRRQGLAYEALRLYNAICVTRNCFAVQEMHERLDEILEELGIKNDN